MIKMTPGIRVLRLLFATALTWCLISSAVAAKFLEPDQAFRLKANLNENALVLQWDIAKGYKLYRDKFNFGLVTPDTSLPSTDLPKGKVVMDPYFKKEVEIYKGKVLLSLPLPSLNRETPISIRYQGCADSGLCYQPIEKRFIVGPGITGSLAEAPIPDDVDTTQSAPLEGNVKTVALSNSDGADDSNLAQRTLQSGSLWKIGLAFLVFGLLLSFTPCVLPMIPILSSIIVGQNNVSKTRGFSLALSYCSGMALVYTSMGVAAGLAGEGLAASLQKPWVLISFATLLVLFALSMFDVYQLQLPAALNDRLNLASSRAKGGHLAGVFVMGALSSLIVGPCVAGPLAGALVYISQTRDVLIGGWALFFMATGMSVPLLLTGLSAGTLLPRAGAWMNNVKYVFGLLLFAVAIWMILPLLNAQMTMILFGAYAILCAVFLRVFESMPPPVSVGRRFLKALGVLVFLLGCLQLIGAMAGASDPLHPLRLESSRQSAPAGNGTSVRFMRISSVAELDKVLKVTKQPVLLDFYADWCVSCKEMERFTFSDPKVTSKLQNVTLLQADVTRNSVDDRALMKRFGLFGPPGLILFNSAGSELEKGRVIGFIDPDKFVQHIDKHL